ncbi:GNAT family N-acetyltransferase [Tsukamurella strandjordii]|nr:hypothetical protein TTY48_11650 [Tsukamurella sp. TY48]
MLGSDWHCENLRVDTVIVTRRPEHPDAAAQLHAYMTDVASRWYSRPATREEIAQALADEPADDLTGPGGYLAVIELDGVALGIGGIRFFDAETAELTKIYTEPSARGRGLGTAIVDHLESVAAVRGRTIARLDTRSDLVEACRLYERSGYQRVPAFSDSPYSDRWYAKPLAGH